MTGEHMTGELMIGELMIVDSWLVDDGQVLAFDAHVRRFATACDDMYGLGADQVRDFMLAGMASVPAAGRWFPRAELTATGGEPRLEFRLRPAPPLGAAVRLWLSGEPDARQHPAVKGPDLDWLAARRAAAVAAGADEAVLLDPDGRILEGAATSILWWRGNTLCAPPEDGGVLPGTTRSFLLTVAEGNGVPVALERPLPADLSGLEVWAVNALHGIRPVTGWLDTGGASARVAAGPATRASHWRAILNEAAAAVPGRRSVSHGR